MWKIKVTIRYSVHYNKDEGKQQILIFKRLNFWYLCWRLIIILLFKSGVSKMFYVEDPDKRCTLDHRSPLCNYLFFCLKEDKKNYFLQNQSMIKLGSLWITINQNVLHYYWDPLSVNQGPLYVPGPHFENRWFKWLFSCWHDDVITDLIEKLLIKILNFSVVGLIWTQTAEPGILTFF